MRAAAVLAAILLAAYLPACTSSRVLADPAADLQASPKPVKKAWITLQSGAHFQLTSPYVAGDSLWGVSELSRPTSVAMSDVVRVEVRNLSEGKTALLLLSGIVVVLLAVGAYISWYTY